jgi:hypothetical protein
MRGAGRQPQRQVVQARVAGQPLVVGASMATMLPNWRAKSRHTPST